MAIVQMKCPSCGGNMLYNHNQFECPYCHTILLNIIDAKIDGDVTIMGADEFSKKLEESKRQFVVNIHDRLEVGDVGTMVANKNLKDAKMLLDFGEYNEVWTKLRDVPDCFTKCRLDFLAHHHVHSEAELMYYDGKLKRESYEKALKYADEPTKNTYIKLAELNEIREKIKEEVYEVEKLWEVDLKQEALAYAKTMCQRYPQSAVAWSTLFDIKTRIDSNYVGDMEYERMIACPDYKGGLPRRMKERFDWCLRSPYTGMPESLPWFIYSALCGIVCCVGLTYFLGLIMQLWTVPDFMIDSAFFAIIMQLGIPLLALAAFIAMIVFFVKAVREIVKIFPERDVHFFLSKIPKKAQNDLIEPCEAVLRKELPARIGAFATVAILIVTLVSTGLFIPYMLHPTIDGVTYGPSDSSVYDGYDVVEIRTDESTFIVPEKVLFTEVAGFSYEFVVESDVPITEIVMHYRAGKRTYDLSAFTSLERIFLDAPYPTPGCEDEVSWNEVLEEKYKTDATIYWQGEWSMENGKPVVL